MITNLSELMEKNLYNVWNERDAVVRLNNLKSLYIEDSTLFEIDMVANGVEAINVQVSHLLDSLPRDFVFTQQKPILINNNVGRLIWGVGPKGQDPVQIGMDIAFFDGSKIRFLYVFLEK